MNALMARFRVYWRARSPRERWLVVLALCIASLLATHIIVIGPLDARAERVRTRVTSLDREVSRALNISSEVRLLQGGLQASEARIQSGESTNLLSLLERLAQESSISKAQLDSIKPKRASENARYPETRVEVSLKGTTLSQAVDYLYKIEHAPILLIIRSLRVTARGGDPATVDVVFSVSTFERA